MGMTKVLVITGIGAPPVVAYYAWTMAQVTDSSIPKQWRGGAGSYPQPVVLLARLGVDVGHEGNGLGARLLQHVILGTARLSTNIGCRGLLIHCETQHARDFYLHLVPEFQSSPSDPLHLLLRTKDIRKTLGM